MIRGTRYLLCLGLLVSTAAGSVQPLTSEAGPAAAERSDEDIVVTGPSLDALDRYVAELTAAPHGDQLARWNDAVCARAIGIAPAQNAFLANRIISVAREMDIPVQSGRCRPNILVVVTQEADAFARLLLKRHPKLFGAFGGDMAPAKAVNGLLAPRPVRWLNASEWGNAHGAPIVDGNKNFVYSASRLQETTRENATLSLVVVDSTKLDGIKWGSLASYVAMVSLALPAPGAAPNGPTILALFSNRDAKQRIPAALTRWDREYLRNLYATRAAASASAQRAQILTNMNRRAAASNLDVEHGNALNR